MPRIDDTGAGRASNGRSGEGVGQTLGPDVSPRHEMEEIARAAEERRAFGPQPVDLPDDGEPSGGAQQGQDRTRWPEKEAAHRQGPKTSRHQRERVRTGSPDDGNG